MVWIIAELERISFSSVWQMLERKCLRKKVFVFAHCLRGFCPLLWPHTRQRRVFAGRYHRSAVRLTISQQPESGQVCGAEVLFSFTPLGWEQPVSSWVLPSGWALHRPLVLSGSAPESVCSARDSVRPVTLCLWLTITRNKCSGFNIGWGRAELKYVSCPSRRVRNLVGVHIAPDSQQFQLPLQQLPSSRGPDGILSLCCSGNVSRVRYEKHVRKCVRSTQSWVWQWCTAAAGSLGRGSGVSCSTQSWAWQWCTASTTAFPTIGG